MNITSKANYAILTVLFTITCYGQRNQTPIPKPFNQKHWAAVTKNVEFDQYKSTDVVKSGNDEAFAVMLKDVDLTFQVVSSNLM